MSNTATTTRSPRLGAENVAVDYRWEDDEVITERHWIVFFGADHRFDCGRNFDAAKSVLQEVAALHNTGRELFSCGWMVEVATEDGPSVRDCGAPSWEDADGRGWSCAAGHAHRSDVEYYEEDEVQHILRNGFALAPNAAYMDGRSI